MLIVVALFHIAAVTFSKHNSGYSRMIVTISVVSVFFLCAVDQCWKVQWLLSRSNNSGNMLPVRR